MAVGGHHHNRIGKPALKPLWKPVSNSRLKKLVSGSEETSDEPNQQAATLQQQAADLESDLTERPDHLKQAKNRTEDNCYDNMDVVNCGTSCSPSLSDLAGLCPHIGESGGAGL